MGKSRSTKRNFEKAPNADLYVPTDGLRKKRVHRTVREGARTEVDPKVRESLTHGIQRDKKRANYDKFRQQKKDAKRERRQRRAAERKVTGAAKEVPKTKENMRLPVPDMVDDANDLEIRRDEQQDEFSEFYAQTRERVASVSPAREDENENNNEDEDQWEDENENNNNNNNNQEQKQEEEEKDDEDLLDENLKENKALAAAFGVDLDDGENDDLNLGEDDDDDETGKKKKNKNKKNKNNKKEEAEEEEKKPKKMRNPKILITTCPNPSYHTRLFVREALWLLPNSIFRSRRNYTLREIIEYCTEAEYKFVVCIGEKTKHPYELIITHLPEGPTATFRVSNFLAAKDIENVGERTEHYPELNLKNFDTRLGRRVARVLEAMFPATRDFAGRAICTFHNQRDFIFVRTHRYIFDTMEEVRIQELGPRMTLRLMSLQKGTFDRRFGEYEWVRKKKHDENKKEWYL